MVRTISPNPNSGQFSALIVILALSLMNMTSSFVILRGFSNIILEKHLSDYNPVDQFLKQSTKNFLVSENPIIANGANLTCTFIKNEMIIFVYGDRAKVNLDSISKNEINKLITDSGINFASIDTIRFQGNASFNIGADAFSGKTNIKTVLIETSFLNEIWIRVFKDCTSLTKFICPYKINKYGPNVFTNTKIEEITIQCNILAVAFQNIVTLKRVRILTDITDYSASVFQGSNNINLISFCGKQTTSTNLGFPNGIQVHVNKNYSYDTFGGSNTIKDANEININNVHIITNEKESTISGNGNINKVLYENNLRCSCSTLELTKLTFEGNGPFIITTPGFSEITTLETISFASTTGITFDKLSFYKCTSLNNIIFPKTYVEIPTDSFSYSNVTILKIPSRKISKNSFSFCENLVEVHIYATISSYLKDVPVIDSNSFYECRQLTTIYYYGLTPPIDSTGSGKHQICWIAGYLSDISRGNDILVHVMESYPRNTMFSDIPLNNTFYDIPDEFPKSPESTPTQSPKETSTQSAKETPTQSPKETPTQSPKETPTQSPKETPTQSPKETPTQSPKETPTQSPKETPTQSIQVIPDPTVSYNTKTELPTKIITSNQASEDNQEINNGKTKSSANVGMIVGIILAFIIIIVLAILVLIFWQRKQKNDDNVATNAAYIDSEMETNDYLSTENTEYSLDDDDPLWGATQEMTEWDNNDGINDDDNYADSAYDVEENFFTSIYK